MKKLLLASLASLVCTPVFGGEIVTEYATEVFNARSGGNKSRGYCSVSQSGKSVRARLVFMGIADGSLSMTTEEATKFINEYAESQRLNDKVNGPGDLLYYNARISPRLGFSYHIDKITNSKHYSVLGYITAPDQVNLGDADMAGKLGSIANLEEMTFYLIVQALEGALQKCPQ